MDFKISNFCDFTDLMKNHKFDNKIDIISISLFKMTQGYKNFEKYINGLELICRVLPTRLPKLKIVLFIDNSIISEPEIYDRIKKLQDQLILIKYECPNYIKDNKHIELFGTMIRFLPFFEFPENFTNIVMSIDADTNMDDINYIVRDYKFFKKIGSSYHYNTNMFYELLSRWALKDGFTILAGRHMCKVKLPMKMMLEYIECIKAGSCENMGLIKSKMDFNKYSMYPYGIDEYFLNYIMLPYIKKENMKYSVTVRYNIVTPFYYIRLNKHPSSFSPEGKLFTRILKKILNKEYSKDQDYKNLFKEFDDLMYIKTDKDLAEVTITEKQKETAKRYYEEIHELWKKKDYSLMSKPTLKKILNNKEGNYLVKNNIYVYQGKTLQKKYLLDKK